MLFALTRLMFHTRQWSRTADTKRLLPFLPCLCKTSERENQKRETLAVQEGTSAPRELESKGQCMRRSSSTRLPAQPLKSPNSS